MIALCYLRPRRIKKELGENCCKFWKTTKVFSLNVRCGHQSCNRKMKKIFVQKLYLQKRVWMFSLHFSSVEWNENHTQAVTINLFLMWSKQRSREPTMNATCCEKSFTEKQFLLTFCIFLLSNDQNLLRQEEKTIEFWNVLI
jgi:hypothetical protein